MMQDVQSFEQLMFAEDVAKDLRHLEGSQLKYVLKALKRIEESKGEIGESLGARKDINLHGYKKVKLKKQGIRIVFKKIQNQIIVAEIIVIGQREELKVYREALKRIKNNNK